MQLLGPHIIESEARLVAAMKNGDVATLDALIHDDLIFITPDGKPATKSMDLDAYRSGNMQVHELEPQMEFIKLFGDTAAISLTAQMKGVYMGQDFEGNFRYLRIWKLFDDQCKIIAGSVSAIAL
jgi:ketosteroid isomerase-like protein